MGVMENKFDLIEKYLMHDMSVGEIKKFEKELSEDSNLRKEFFLRKEINEAILEDDIIDLRESLNEITFNKNSNGLINFIESHKKNLAIAATIIILISLSLSFLYPLRQSSDQLLNSYYNTYPALANVRSLENKEESEVLINESFDFYEKHNYKKASELFCEVLILDNNNVVAQFYLALCELENNNFAESEEYFLDLIRNRDHLFWEQSHWYLAMLYLKQEKKEKAKSIFKEILDKEMVYKNKAKRILKKLD
jgi:tetratricopeptide (TPR) repeat protein